MDSPFSTHVWDRSLVFFVSFITSIVRESWSRSWRSGSGPRSGSLIYLSIRWIFVAFKMIMILKIILKIIIILWVFKILWLWWLYLPYRFLKFSKIYHSIIRNRTFPCFSIILVIVNGLELFRLLEFFRFLWLLKRSPECCALEILCLICYKANLRSPPHSCTFLSILQH